MNVPVWLWFATIAGILVLLAVDLVIVDHSPHTIRVAEAASVGRPSTSTCAVALRPRHPGVLRRPVRGGVLRRLHHRVQPLGRQPLRLRDHHDEVRGAAPVHQHRVLLVGILLALVLRGIFIAAGAAVIERFSWVFYLFGAFLLYTAIPLAIRGERRRGGVQGEPLLRVVAPLPAGHRRLPRRPAVHAGSTASGWSRRCSS